MSKPVGHVHSGLQKISGMRQQGVPDESAALLPAEGVAQPGIGDVHVGQAGDHLQRLCMIPGVGGGPGDAGEPLDVASDHLTCWS